MTRQDLWEDVQNLWLEFRQTPSAIISLFLLAGFLLGVLFEPWLIPFPEAGSRWRDINYWEMNPRNAPPIWINWFSSSKYAAGLELRDGQRMEKQAGKMTILRTEFLYRYHADVPPRDILLHCRVKGSPVLILSIERPDGEKIRLFKKPIFRAEDRKIRISADKDAKDDVYHFAAQFESTENRISKDMIHPARLIFSQAVEGLFRKPQALKGEYRIICEVLLPNDEAQVEDISLLLPGSVSGWLGTDNSKRDIWSGVIAGIRWALLIGIFTAAAAVSVGVIYGVMSAYFGGWRDSLMQRVFEVFVSIPLLPLLIVMSAIFKPSIWTMMLMMSCFFWVGPVKTVRSMGLQIKEETYIEASKAFGASSFRIIFKHMVPLLVPYAFASMALYVPGAIVYESTISLLGLGDSTIVTWGQILHDALSGGAVLNGQWWWVIPPGLAIALMGMTFAFLGFAMDTILHPKLRKM